jgi:hypothetical protein
VSTNDGTTGVQHDPVGAIYSPPVNSQWLQFDAIPVSGLGLDTEDRSLPDASLQWTQSGPGSPTLSIGTGRTLPDLQPPASGGWATGVWTITLTVTDSAGRTSSTSVSYTILPDADHDGIPASKDTTCSGANADNDPTNANGDPDGDGIPTRDDPAPCTSANNATLDFDPDTFKTGDNSTPAFSRVITNAGDLHTASTATVRLVKIGGFPVNITPTSWQVSSTTTAIAYWNRPQINSFLIGHGLTGCVNFTVQGSGTGFSFRGTDCPTVSSGTSGGTGD